MKDQTQQNETGTGTNIIPWLFFAFCSCIICAIAAIYYYNKNKIIDDLDDDSYEKLDEGNSSDKQANDSDKQDLNLILTQIDGNNQQQYTTSPTLATIPDNMLSNSNLAATEENLIGQQDHTAENLMLE